MDKHFSDRKWEEALFAIGRTLGKSGGMFTGNRREKLALF